ncbi:hypothetical protein BH10PSE17_BH10PSE17_22430 [soil metagenome]
MVQADGPSDAASTQQWLAKHGSLESVLLLQHVSALLRDLHERPRPAIPQLAILETLRVRVVDALRNQFGEIDFRAVPMSPTEAATFAAGANLARQMREAYAKLIDATTAEPQRAPNPQERDASRDLLAIFGSQIKPISARALVVQRTLATHSQLIAWSYRSRVTLSPTEWDVLMRYAKLAREHNVAEATVFDPTMPDFNANARGCVTASVLMLLANPSSLGQHAFNLMRDLARRYGARVRYRIDDGAAATKPGPWPALTSSGSTLRMDTRALADEIKRMAAELDAGYSPESLGFDRRISLSTARETIGRLAVAWRTPAPTPPQWRRPLVDTAQAVASFHSIQAGLARAQFDPTASMTRTQSVYEYSRVDVVPITMDDPAAVRMKMLLSTSEAWQIEGENVQGFQCRRRAATPRINIDQLVVMNIGNAGRAALFLGRIDSLRQDAQHGFGDAAGQEVGVKLLRGSPMLVGLKLDAGTFEDAFLLRPAPPGATVSMNDSDEINAQTATLIVPLARWRDGSVTEMLADGRTQRVQFDKLVFRGQDYDQIQFKLL